MKVPYLDLTVSQPDEKAALHEVLESLLTRGRIVAGPEVTEFESLMARVADSPHSVAVSSGTAAVWMALRLVGVGPGDEVITSALGWLGSINPIYVCGARPRFVDIRPDLNLSPEAVRKAITKKTRAILVVHYTGLPCPMDELMAISHEFGIPLVEDCAQSFGAKWRDRPVGSIGAAGAFSMNPMKLFGAIGECGAVTFAKDEWLHTARALRHNGLQDAESCLAPSLNLKPDTLQCGFLNARHKVLHRVMERREENAQRYRKGIGHLVTVPSAPPEVTRVYYTYMIRAQRRDELQRHLASCGVESKVRHPVLLNEQEAYQDAYAQIGGLRDTPEADLARHEILCLPVHEKLTDEQVDHVITCVSDFYNRP